MTLWSWRRGDGLLGGGGIPSPHQLNLLLALAKELHFRRAARRVFMSQGAFSQQISALERRLGVALLPRSAVAAELSAKTLVQVSVTDAPAVSQKIVIIRRRDQGRASGTVAAFLNLVRESDPAALAS